MIVNDPQTLAEVTAAFARYEQALVTNDVAVLNELFWDSPLTLRYGQGENLYGHAEISGFRRGRSPAGLAREVLRTVVTTYGKDAATTNIEFRRIGQERIGRQSQCWMRMEMPDGHSAWRIVAAHVSWMA